MIYLSWSSYSTNELEISLILPSHPINQALLIVTNYKKLLYCFQELLGAQSLIHQQVLWPFLLGSIMQGYSTGERTRNVSKDYVNRAMGFSSWGYEACWLLDTKAEPGGMWINRARGAQASLTEPISGSREFEFKGD